MKNLLTRSVVLFSVFLFAAPFGMSQASDAAPSKRELQARLQKTEYLLLEPIAVEFRLTDPPPNMHFSLPRAVSVTVTHSGIATEYHQLTWYISDEFPQQAPGKPPQSLGPYTPTPPGYMSDQVIIDRAEEFFPVAGKYEVQFWLPDLDGKIIRSKVVELSIKEPTGVDRDAWQALKKHKEPLSFMWVWSEKDGLSALRAFVDEYGDSVYGDIAIEYLGGIYFMHREFEKAEVEFKKLKTSSDKVFRDHSVEALDDIERERPAVKP